jgi:hypothetical protein
VREIGYGGQAGGGKSFGLILDPLYQIVTPGFNAIIFRRTYKRLKEADGLIDLSFQVYPYLGGEYHGQDYRWTFPNGNTIRFSHIEHENNIHQYSGSQYAYIGFDELQEFTKRQYLFLFSRNRSTNSDISLFVRSTFNPGGIGHSWIKKRFIDTDIRNRHRWFSQEGGVEIEVPAGQGVSRMFIPASLEDNPYLYQGGDGDYEKGLRQLDNVDYQRLRHGDWSIRRTGLVYHGFTRDNIAPSSRQMDLSQASFYHSHDFGAVNRAWGLFAKIDGTYFLVHEAILPPGSTEARARIIRQHLKGKQVIAGYGGSKSEKQQRADYRQAGVQIREPVITDVESQISITNKMFETGELMICSDCTMTIDQLDSCVRDDSEGIADKSVWHNLDVLRYFAAGVNRRGWVW